MKRTIVVPALSLAAAGAFGAESNEVFSPNDLAKNPYQFRGHSGCEVCAGILGWVVTDV